MLPSGAGSTLRQAARTIKAMQGVIAVRVGARARVRAWPRVPDFRRLPIVNQHLLHQAVEEVLLLRVGSGGEHLFELR